MVRGLTRRLERLQAGVETLGAGDLSARVQVKGRDEIAQLAASFNRAAARIEELVGAHRMLLANASHELRTPLSRIRLGARAAARSGGSEISRELERDIAELDTLIDEILLASRLEAVPHSRPKRSTCSRSRPRRRRATRTAKSTAIRHHQRRRAAARRLLRNLLDNADKHGKPPVRVTIRRVAGRATLRVEDAGAGVPPADRDRVFTPFTRVAGDGGGAELGLSLVRNDRAAPWRRRRGRRRPGDRASRVRGDLAG